MSVGEQCCGQVSVAGIGEKNDDRFAGVFGTLGKLDRGVQRCAGGNADQHALGFADQFAGSERVLVADGDDLVIDAGIERVRDESRADALHKCPDQDQCRTSYFIGNNRKRCADEAITHKSDAGRVFPEKGQHVLHALRFRGHIQQDDRYDRNERCDDRAFDNSVQRKHYDLSVDRKYSSPKGADSVRLYPFFDLGEHLVFSEQAAGQIQENTDGEQAACCRIKDTMTLDKETRWDCLTECRR